MARKTATRTVPAAARTAPEPRTVLLAGVGAISLGRKQFLRAYADGFRGLAAARDHAQDVFVSAAAQLDAQVDDLRRQAERWRKKAKAYRGQVEHRFGPLLAKLGVPVRTPRAARKPAKAVVRRRRAG